MRKLVIWYWWQSPLFLLINSQNFFFTKKLILKIDCAISTRCHGKHTMYVSLLWPPVVAAHDCKGLAEALRSGRSYSAKNKNYAWTQDSVTFIGLCRSWYPIKIAFATTIKKGQGQMLKHIVIYIYIYIYMCTIVNTPSLPTSPALYGIFHILFICCCFCNRSGASTVYRKWYVGRTESHEQQFFVN